MRRNLFEDFLVLALDPGILIQHLLFLDIQTLGFAFQLHQLVLKLLQPDLQDVLIGLLERVCWLEVALLHQGALELIHDFIL